MKTSSKSAVTFEDSQSSYSLKVAAGTGETNQGSTGGHTQKRFLDVDKPSRVLNRQSADYNHRFKVILLGDSKVGKTSIVRRLVDESFNNRYEETTFYDTVNKRVMVDDGDVVLMHIFDTAGLDRFDSLQGSYFQGASGFVIVFDYTKRETFENVPRWIKVLKERATITDPTIVILGNKIDIQDKSRFQVSAQDVNTLKQSDPNIIIQDVSAKMDMNLTEAIKSMCSKMIESMKKNQAQNAPKGTRLSRISHFSTHKESMINMPEDLMGKLDTQSNTKSIRLQSQRPGMNPNRKKATCC